MSNKKTVFQDIWLLNSKFDWAERVKDNNYVCYCKICKKSFNLSNMGKSALVSHMDGNKHIAAVNARNAFNKMEDYLKSNNEGIVFVNLIQKNIF